MRSVYMPTTRHHKTKNIKLVSPSFAADREAAICPRTCHLTKSTMVRNKLGRYNNTDEANRRDRQIVALLHDNAALVFQGNAEIASQHHCIFGVSKSDQPTYSRLKYYIKKYQTIAKNKESGQWKNILQYFNLEDPEGVPQVIESNGARTSTPQECVDVEDELQQECQSKAGSKEDCNDNSEAVLPSSLSNKSSIRSCRSSTAPSVAESATPSARSQAGDVHREIWLNLLNNEANEEHLVAKLKSVEKGDTLIDALSIQMTMGADWRDAAMVSAELTDCCKGLVVTRAKFPFIFLSGEALESESDAILKEKKRFSHTELADQALLRKYVLWFPNSIKCNNKSVNFATSVETSPGNERAVRTWVHEVGVPAPPRPPTKNHKSHGAIGEATTYHSFLIEWCLEITDESAKSASPDNSDTLA